ncbi:MULTISPECIES: hypothetical protein [Aphanothece]|uniref:glycosyl-4,4'-diaponeurosporenoate acyltransferase CrtO family protein n=1 Tax=Aphanothece TaxID=1121 RepID=UPI0039852C38
MGIDPLLSSGLGWLAWSVLVGGLANRVPARVLAGNPALPGRPRGRCSRQERLRRFEQQLAIRAWKGWLPDAGGALPGGIPKARLVGRDRDGLERLVVETRRAELVHLALWPFWLVTALWLPPLGVVINLVFATLFNLPCIALQRYNRLRLERLLERWDGTPQAGGDFPVPGRVRGRGPRP